MTFSVDDFTSVYKPTWCPGCGNYGMLAAVKKAIVSLGINPENFFVSSGIGCGSKFPHHLKSYGFHSIHGRPIPFATGVKLANYDLTVLVVAGDGDLYGIGGNHFIHGLRRNLDITVFVQNNMVYALTKGQTSPTSWRGFVSKSTPHGNIEPPVNPIELSLAAGATFVARTFSGDLKHMTEMFTKAIAHKGSAIVDMLTPCLAFNKVNTLQWFRERVYKLENHDASDIKAAHAKGIETERFPLGVFYSVDRPTYADGLPQLKDQPLVRDDISNINISKTMERYV